MIASSNRLDFLRACQNSDGGWGYFPGKRSWLEPTVYGAVALAGDAAADRAFGLIQSWALGDGGWQISAEVAEANWTSALGLNLYMSRGVDDATFRGGLRFLVRTLGAEGNALSRLAQLLWQPFDMDLEAVGWPWKSGCASWVEPTVHSVITLTKVLPKLDSREADAARERLRMGEAMLHNRQCEDGGWNYGNRRVLGEKLPSYAELTGLGLLGLQHTQWPGRDDAIRKARLYGESRISPLGAAWLTLALRINNIPVETHPSWHQDANDDVVVNALFAVAESQGGLDFFRRAGL